MTITLSAGTPSPTSIAFNLANLGGSGTVELQLAMRADFKWCICPVLAGLPLQGTIGVTGLNQLARYYARARTRLGSGVAEPWSNVWPFYTPQQSARDLTEPLIAIGPAMLVVPEPIISIQGDANSVGEIAGFPAVNLTLDSPVAWRSAASNGVFAVDFQVTGAPLDTVALLRTNASEGATATLVGGSSLSNVQGGGQYSSGSVAFRASPNLPGREGGYHGLISLPTSQSYPWWRLTVSVPQGVPGGIFHAEHLAVGLNRVTKNQTVGATEQGANLGSLDRTRSGVSDRQDGYRIRHTEFDLSNLTERQFQQFYRDLWHKVNDPVLVVPNTEAGPFLHDRILYGPLNAAKSVNNASIFETRTIAIDSLV